MEEETKENLDISEFNEPPKLLGAETSTQEKKYLNLFCCKIASNIIITYVFLLCTIFFNIFSNNFL